MRNESECEGNTDVAWCTWNGGHAWPDDYYGKQAGTRMIWEFFKTHAK